MTALDCDTGKTRWVFDATSATPEGQIHGTPLLDSNLMFIPVDSPAGGFVHAVDRCSGAERWRASTEGAQRSGGFTTDILAHGKLVITISAHHEVVAFDRDSGVVKWSRQLSGRGQRRHSATMLRGELYCSDGASLVALDPATGKIIRRVFLPAEASTSAGTIGARLVVGLTDSQLAVVDRRGSTKFLSLPHAAYSVPMAIGKSILVLTAGNEIVALDESLGRLLWRRAADREWSSPRIVAWRGLAIIGDDKGKVLALDPQSGAVRRTGEVPGVVRGIGSSGETMFVGTLNGNVYAIKLH